jgi:hypothetical protein
LKPYQTLFFEGDCPLSFASFQRHSRLIETPVKLMMKTDDHPEKNFGRSMGWSRIVTATQGMRTGWESTSNGPVTDLKDRL